MKTFGALNKHKHSYLVSRDTTLRGGGEKKEQHKKSFFIGSSADSLRLYCSVIARILQPRRGDCKDTDIHLSKASPLQECFVVHLLQSECMVSFFIEVSRCATLASHTQLTGFCHCVHIWVRNIHSVTALGFLYPQYK